MSEDLPERIARAVAVVWRRRVAHLEGHDVVEDDGTVLALSGLSEPSWSALVVEREPSDPDAVLARARERYAARGLPLGVVIAAGRHASVDRAVREAGLVVHEIEPGMAIAVGDLADPSTPTGVRMSRVEAADELTEIARIETAVYGTSAEVARAFFSPGLLEQPGTAAFVARDSARVVAMTYTQAVNGMLGVFGVATMPEHRGRGIGAAITAFAVRAADADIAWLQASAMGRPVYERLGFRAVADWEVWVEPSRG